MSDSVSEWLQAFKGGDDRAAQMLWDRYFQQLVQVLRRRVQRDEEDLAQDVFATLCRIARSGRLRSKNRDELWRLLMRITRVKSIDRYRQDSRRPTAELGMWDDEASQDRAPVPTPEVIAILNDELQFLLDRLPDETYERIVKMKMERYTNREIAEKLGVVERTVERKMRIIRREWASEIE